LRRYIDFSASGDDSTRQAHDGKFGHGGVPGALGWIDPNRRLISILLIQRADGGTESMTRIFLNMGRGIVTN